MDSLIDEVESLEAILMEDVKVHRNFQTNAPEVIETTIFPVGSETDKHICVTLQVIPTPGYPETSPKFNLLKPRGLDDQRLNDIKAAIIEKLDESLGYPVVFDLIEVVREHLTGSSLPCGQCVVCLYGFQEGDEFTKTECFHYLHSFCLARHLVASKRNYQEEISKLPAWLKKTAETFQAVCPVCREKISDNAESLHDSRPPTELENAADFQLTKDLKELQHKMSSLFLRQKSRGAIIDVSAEDKNVISIETEEQMMARLEQERLKKLAATQGNHRTGMDPAYMTATNGDDNESNSEEGNVPNAPNGQNCHSTCNSSASSSRITVNHTNFAPIINTAPTRYAPAESTNNNYNHQYNRRHFRGGNRRFHRERDRFRVERDQPTQQQLSEENNATNTANSTSTTSEASSQPSATANGKGRHSSGKNQKSGFHKR